MLKEKLRKRANAGLSNKAEDIESEALDEAVAETQEIVAQKDLQTPYLVDIAYYRLLLILDAQISEQDTFLYERALRELQTAPLKKESEDDSKREFDFAIVAQKRSDWQCL